MENMSEHMATNENRQTVNLDKPGDRAGRRPVPAPSVSDIARAAYRQGETEGARKTAAMAGTAKTSWKDAFFKVVVILSGISSVTLLLAFLFANGMTSPDRTTVCEEQMAEEKPVSTTRMPGLEKGGEIFAGQPVPKSTRATAQAGSGTGTRVFGRIGTENEAILKALTEGAFATTIQIIGLLMLLLGLMKLPTMESRGIPLLFGGIAISGFPTMLAGFLGN